MEIHFNLTSMIVCHFQLPLSNFDRIWRLMGILAVHYNGMSKQHKRLHRIEIACTIFLFSSIPVTLKLDLIQNKVK